MSEVDDSQSPTGREAARGLGFKNWCGWRGSNPRPLASEANTLSTELQPQCCEVLEKPGDSISRHLAATRRAMQLRCPRYNMRLRAEPVSARQITPQYPDFPFF